MEFTLNLTELKKNYVSISVFFSISLAVYPVTCPITEYNGNGFVE